MSEFEEQIFQEIKKSVIRDISKATYVATGSWDQRRKVPDEIIEKVWKSINWDEVVTQIREEVQSHNIYVKVYV